MKNSVRYCIALMATLSALALSSAAAAQQAYTSSRTSLRAGPDRGYPQVGWLRPGTPVFVNGCVRGYYWCDVSAGSVRGWANARHLQYPYQNRRMAIYGNGATFGLPIVAFALGSYWDNHYRDRSWYNNRPYWNSWRPGHQPPRPPNVVQPVRPSIQPPRPPVVIQPVRPSVQPPRPVIVQPVRPVIVQPQIQPRPQVQPQPQSSVQRQRPAERGMGPGVVGNSR